MPIRKPTLDKSMFKIVPKGVEVITADKEKAVRREFEDATVYVWKTTSPIVNRMLHQLVISVFEQYFSTVGHVVSQTPFWRGRLFTHGVLRHEFLHWGIYPIDTFKALRDLTDARGMLMRELAISERDRDWGKKFPYTINELQLYQNILGDYLVNLHIALRRQNEWRALWKFLEVGGNREKRPSCFKVYLAVYPKLLPHQNLPPINLNDPSADADVRKIVSLIKKVIKGKVGKAYAIKELAKIFHKYYEEDKKHQKGDGSCGGQADPRCPKCGANDWEVKGVLEQDANGVPTKVKIRCKKCGHEMDVEIDPYGGGALRPNEKAHGVKVKWSKDEIDKIAEASRGAGREDLGNIGIDLTEKDWVEAQQRQRVRRFIREHVVVAKELRRRGGEKVKISTDIWQVGDSMLDVNIPSTELASLGIEDLRMIPTLTLRKNIYIRAKGQDVEQLKGVKYFAFLDVSGSMSGAPERKALTMLEEVYEACEKLDFEFHLCLFSSRGKRISEKEIKKFFESATYRNNSSGLGGGTVFTSGLNLFSIEEYKDANICMISDCDLGDIEETKEKMLEIAQHTNSFKIIIIRESYRINDDEIKSLQEQWFPNEEVKILGISPSDEEVQYERY